MCSVQSFTTRNEYPILANDLPRVGFSGNGRYSQPNKKLRKGRNSRRSTIEKIYSDNTHHARE
jgi:hypothetical protein